MTITSITICSLSHKDVWRLTAPLMLKNLSIDRYQVFVPEVEMEAFAEITPADFEIKSQRDLGPNFARELMDALTLRGNSDRYGWYAQQFMKIEALRRADSEKIVIWDADCVPVRPVPLFSQSGSPLYMIADEGHEPYFRVISEIFGEMERSPNTFVIPGFPYFRSWLEELIEEVENLSGTNWEAALISKSDLASQSGFSETETLGTWALNRHPEEFEWHRLNWERRGTSRFGYAKTFTATSLAKVANRHNLDIISFENWDLRGMRLFAYRTINKFRKFVGLTSLQPIRR